MPIERGPFSGPAVAKRDVERVTTALDSIELVLGGATDEISNICYELRTANLLAVALSMSPTIGSLRRERALKQALDRLALGDDHPIVPDEGPE